MLTPPLLMPALAALGLAVSASLVFLAWGRRLSAHRFRLVARAACARFARLPHPQKLEIVRLMRGQVVSPVVDESTLERQFSELLEQEARRGDFDAAWLEERLLRVGVT